MTTVIREPSVTANLISANTVVENAEQKILIVGQLASTGSTAVAGTLYQSLVAIDDVEALFGKRSMIAQMYRNVRKENNFTRIDCIPQANNPPAGVKAAGSFSITGTATSSGTVVAVVGSEPDQTYTVGVASGDTGAVVLAALKALIDADLTSPVTAGTVAAPLLPLNCDFGGVLGNEIGLKISSDVTGLVCTINAMSAGAGVFAMTGVLDPVAQIRYQTILWAYNYETTVIKSFLDDRFNVANDVLDGVALIYKTASYAGVISYLSALNSNSLTVFADRLVTTTTTRSGGSFLEYPWNIISQFGAIRAARRTEGANLSKWVIASNGSLDRTGGIGISSLPYFNTPMTFLPLLEQGLSYGWTFTEEDAIKAQGGSVLGNNYTNTAVLVGEVLTTYKTDPASNPDPTWKFLEYVDTSSSIREYYSNNLRSRFRQHRLTTGAILAGRAMANASIIAAVCSQYYNALSLESLSQAGEAYYTFYKKNLIVTLDLVNGKASISMLMPIVTQLREIITNIQIDFTSEG